MKKQLKKLVKLHDGKDYFISNQIRELSKKNYKKIIKKIKKIEYVFVADNPGEKEISNKNNITYLNPNGHAGKNFENFIKWLGISRDECLILNKTIKHTKLTKGLASDLDWKSQKEVANVLNKLMKVNSNAKICLLGFKDFYNTSDKSIFKEFYENLKDSDMLRAYYHPSRRQLFTIDEQKKIETKIPIKQRKEYFDSVGKKQYESRKKKVTNI